MLQYRPKQSGVDCTTPSAAELAACKVELGTGGAKGSSGWVLSDAGKMRLRSFFDSNGDNRIDVWSYYKDGVEIYREIDSNGDDRADQFRWLNGGGSKWGVDANGDGRIDAWKSISSEEVAEEVFESALSGDSTRLTALFITEAEIRTMNFPPARAEQLRKLRVDAATSFQQAIAKLPGFDKSAELVRVEPSTPQCLPADTTGLDQDLIEYPSRIVLYKSSDGKHGWLQTGEMIQVGTAWRLISPPMQEGAGTTNPAAQPNVAGSDDPRLQKLFDQLSDLDKLLPEPPAQSGPNKAICDYNMRRALLLEQIVALEKSERRDQWLKQLFDNLSTAAQTSAKNDTAAITKLAAFKEQVSRSEPRGKMAAYGAYRMLWAIYAPKLTGASADDDVTKVQEEWMQRLAEFVQTYPDADDTPDSLHHLGMGSEFSGKDDEALRWYQQLTQRFPEHMHASRAMGAQRRLKLVGNTMDLSGTMLSTKGPFEMSRLKGKVVVVYYWASYCTTCVKDFEKLNELRKANAAKGFELVLVNLDEREEQALDKLRSNPVVGVHLFQPGPNGGGLNSPLATYYGILGLPSMFLVDREGKVISRTMQSADLEKAIQKALQ